MKNTAAIAAVAVLVAGLALAGCSGATGKVQESDPASVPVATDSANSEPPAAPSTVVQRQTLPARATFVGVGPRVVVINDTSNGQSVYRLYGPGTESGGAIQIDALGDTSRVEGQWDAVQLDPASTTALAHVTLEKKPNDGLSAGGQQLTIRTFDVNGTAVGEASIPVLEGVSTRSISQVGLLGDTVVLLDKGLTSSGKGQLAEAIDVTTAKIRWSVGCGSVYSSTSPMYAGEGVVAMGCDLDGVQGLDLATGKKRWQQDGGSAQVFRYDPSSPGVLGVTDVGSGVDASIDLFAGKLLNRNPHVPVIGDPVTGLQAVGKLSVYDPKSKATVLEIDKATIDQLGDFTPISAFDGRLTFMASDGLNVVSLTTGKADPDSPAKSSQKQSYTNVIADSGTGWVLLGSVDARWDPDSWTNSSPIAASTVVWATGADATLSWGDIGAPSIVTP